MLEQHRLSFQERQTASPETPTHVIDAYEFVAISILLASRLNLADKVCLLCKLFDLNGNNKGLSQVTEQVQSLVLCYNRTRRILFILSDTI